MNTIQEAAKEYADRLVHPKDAYWITASEEKIFMSSAFQAGAIWQEQQGWVRVDTPPEEGQVVDTWNGKANRRAIFDAGKFYRHFDLADGDRVARVYYPDITHYRPLPSPPGSTPIESKEGKYRGALEKIAGLTGDPSVSETEIIMAKEIATEALKQ